MKRKETISVWNPKILDEVFGVDCDGRQLESITKETDSGQKHIGSRPTGSRVTFEIQFPNAEQDSESMLNEIIEITDFKHSPQKHNGQFTIYDMEFNSAFDIGCETDSKIVLHAKQNTKAESIKKVYNLIKNKKTTVQVIRYKYIF